MDIQTIFYLMGIIFMSVIFLLMVALIIVLFRIKNKISELEHAIQEKIEFASSVGQIGGKAVEIAVDKIKNIVDKKK